MESVYIGIDALRCVHVLLWRNRRSYEKYFLPFKVKPLTKAATETFTEALDVLQNEENMFIVWVIPTIKLLNEKMVEFYKDPTIMYCIPLVFAIHTGLNVRYLNLSKQNHLIIPLVSDPIFKMIWNLEDNNKNEHNK
jgi:hypothetical protein